MSNEYETWKAYAENLQAQRENDSATIEELKEALKRVEAELAMKQEAEPDDYYCKVCGNHGCVSGCHPDYYKHQEAQGEQAGAGRAEVLARLHEIAYRDTAVSVTVRAADLRATLATQPAAGEPEQQTAINADDLPTKKYPLGAFDFDAPVASGEQAKTSDELAAFEKWRHEQADSLRRCGYPDGAEAFIGLGSVHWAGWQARSSLATPPAAAHGDKAVQIDARLLELYQAPFRFDERGGYIWDAQNNMVADNHVDGDQAIRVRGWGRLSYRKDGEEVQDLMGQAMADALTARWEAAMRAQEEK